MARYVVFNGKTKYKPGGLSKINAAGMAQVNVDARGTVGIVGEADLGAPGEIYTLDDPVRITEYFGEGPLADACRLAFSPSNDSRISGGANRVYAIKPNNSLQSGSILYNSSGVEQLRLTSVGYGSPSNQITHQFQDLGDNSYSVTVRDNYDSTVESGSINCTPMLIVKVKGPNTHYIVKSGTCTVGSNWSSAFDATLSQFTTDDVGRFFVVVGPATHPCLGEIRRIDTFVGATQVSFSSFFPGAGGLTEAGPIYAEYEIWDYKVFDNDDSALASTYDWGKIVSDEADIGQSVYKVKLSPSFYVQDADLAGYTFGVEKNGFQRVVESNVNVNIQPELLVGVGSTDQIAVFTETTNCGSQANATLKYAGKRLVVTLAGGGPAANETALISSVTYLAGVITATLATKLSAALVNGVSKIKVIDNTNCYFDSTQVYPSTGNADAYNGATPFLTGSYAPSQNVVVFVDATNSLETLKNLLEGNILYITVTGSGTSAPQIGETALIDSVEDIGDTLTNGFKINLTALSDAINSYALTAAQKTGGGGTATSFKVYEYNTIPSVINTDDDIYLLNTVSGCTMTVAGSNGVATELSTTLTWDSPHASGTVKDAEFDFVFATEHLSTVQQLVEKINATYLDSSQQTYGSIYDAVRGSVPTTTLISKLDFDTNNTSVDVRYDYPTNWDYSRLMWDLQTIVNWYNTYSVKVTAARSTTPGATVGSGIPRDYLNPTYLTGGSKGDSSNSLWQAALDELLTVRCNAVVTCIAGDIPKTSDPTQVAVDWVSAAQMLSQHVNDAEGVNERIGYIGYYSATKTELLSAIQSINNYNVMLTAEKIQALDATSTVNWMDEWALGAIAAGCRAGAELGEPLTNKYIQIVDMDVDAFDPTDTTDINDMLKGGLLFVEYVSGKGYRFVKDLTTWTIDDNLAFTDGSVRDVVNEVSYGVRTFIEERFTGTRATVPIVTSVKEAIVTKLSAYRDAGAIVDSLDSNGVQRNAWYNLRVYLEGDVLSYFVNIFPVTGINFELGEIGLQLPRISV